MVIDPPFFGDLEAWGLTREVHFTKSLVNQDMSDIGDKVERVLLLSHFGCAANYLALLAYDTPQRIKCRFNFKFVGDNEVEEINIIGIFPLSLLSKVHPILNAYAPHGELL